MDWSIPVFNRVVIYRMRIRHQETHKSIKHGRRNFAFITALKETRLENKKELLSKTKYNSIKQYDNKKTPISINFLPSSYRCFRVFI